MSGGILFVRLLTKCSSFGVKSNFRLFYSSRTLLHVYNKTLCHSKLIDSLRHIFKQRLHYSKPIFNPSLVLAPICLALGGCHGNVVKCRHGNRSTRLNPLRSQYLRSGDRELQFDWWQLWDIISPDLLLLLLAVGVSYKLIN